MSALYQFRGRFGNDRYALPRKLIDQIISRRFTPVAGVQIGLDAASLPPISELKASIRDCDRHWGLAD